MRILLLLLLTSCLQTTAIGVATSASVKALQERSFGNAIDDLTIWTKLKHYYLQKDVDNIFSKVNIEVMEGRVLLTGSVKNVESRIEAVKLAWKPEGVKEVINEIHIRKNKNLKSYAKDKWITLNVKSKMLLNKDVASINYSIETVNQVVYLLGVARDEDELKNVTNIASSVSGVEKVVNYVRFRK